MNKNKLLAYGFYLFMILNTLPHLIVSMDRDFHMAVLKSDIPKIEELLKKNNIDINATTGYMNDTFLCIAVSKCDIDMFRFLLRQPSIDI